ncbi:serine/threonine-protein kinase [Sorangium sp. So ce1000]|uniref:serine/threonine-protein kinase n=1 Tax=Sorangium sp. So ce1000 TaxID=3133325 RepID=UPI003F62D137
MIGQKLGGKYTIDRLIGEGGMGAVYEGHHAGTGRRVAVKVITGDIAKNPKLARRFEVEAQAAATIASDHVVQVFDVGHDECGAPFMVMEHLAGEDVAGLLARVSALAPEAAVKIAVQACLGLVSAHARGIVHRDVKPGNLFLCARDGGGITVKLLDFGIAKITGEASAGAKLTRSGAIVGSPIYMSPEQARTVHNIDHRTDLWSLGVVLYEMLAGHAPHHDTEALGALILAICSRPVPPLRSAAPWVDPRLAAAVERALVIDPAGRYQSAGEMATVLRTFLPGGSAELTADMLVPADRRGAPEAAHGALAFATTTRGELIPPVALVPHVPPIAPLAPSRSAEVELVAVTPPPPSPRPAAAKKGASPSPALFVAGGLVLAALGVGGAFALGWIGRDSAPSGVAPASGLVVSGGGSASGTPAVVPTTQAGTPGEITGPITRGLGGVWRSSSKGRVYDAVPAGDGVELRVRDPEQLAGQGYEKGEARFVLSPIPGDLSLFAVEDRVRPLPPERTSYDEARARPTCLVTRKEVGAKPLRARLDGDTLTVDVVVLEADLSNFVFERGRVVRCEGLDRARMSVSERPNVYVRQRQ